MFNIYSHFWPKLDNKAKQKEKTSYAYCNSLKLNYAPQVQFLKRCFYFCPKNIGRYDHFSVLTVAYSLAECGSSWISTQNGTTGVSCSFTAEHFCSLLLRNLEHLPRQVTQIDIWSLITFITRHNRFKFSVSSRPLQLDCCDESPGLPSPGSQRCSCACHCIYGLRRTGLHIGIQILQVQIRYNLWDYTHYIVFCHMWCHTVL